MEILARLRNRYVLLPDLSVVSLFLSTTGRAERNDTYKIIFATWHRYIMIWSAYRVSVPINLVILLELGVLASHVRWGRKNIRYHTILFSFRYQ